MRRTLGIIALATIAALAVAQTSGNSLLSSFGKALNDAKTVRSTYSAQTIGSASETYTIALKKPNLARIETPAGMVVADGKNVYTYNKAENSYFKRPQTETEVKSLLVSDELNLLAGFFDANAYQAPKSRSLGKRPINGTPLTVIEAANGKKTKTYFIDGTDNVARKAQIELNDPNGKVTTILDTKSMDLNVELPDSTFAFTPPAGARELTQDEIDAGKWYKDLDEAIRVAKASGKRVFIDFMATWCGPCKMLEKECFNTPQMKALGKKYVFCQIDVDQQPSLAKKYSATSIPLQVILDKNGNVQDQMVGYGGAHPFFAWMHKNAR